MHIFKISKAQLIESLKIGAVFALAYFLIGFTGGIDLTNFFVNLDWAIIGNAFVLGVNEVWTQLWTFALPFVYNFIRPDKK